MDCYLLKLFKQCKAEKVKCTAKSGCDTINNRRVREIEIKHQKIIKATKEFTN